MTHLHNQKKNGQARDTASDDGRKEAKKPVPKVPRARASLALHFGFQDTCKEHGD